MVDFPKSGHKCYSNNLHIIIIHESQKGSKKIKEVMRYLLDYSGHFTQNCFGKKYGKSLMSFHRNFQSAHNFSLKLQKKNIKTHDSSFLIK